MQKTSNAGVQNTQEENSILENLKMLFSPKYYKEQLSGWQLPSYLLMMFGIGVLIGFYISSKDYGFYNSISTIGGIIGFACVNSIAQNRPLNGILGFGSAILIIINAVHATAYNDVLMQLSYILVLDIPIILRGRAWQNKKIHMSGTKEMSIIIAFFVVVASILFYSDTHWFVSNSPFFDSIGAAIGLTGALAMMLKSKAQTFWWIAQGILSIALWADLAMKGNTSPTLLVVYILYFMNNILMITVSPWGYFKKNK